MREAALREGALLRHLEVAVGPAAGASGAAGGCYGGLLNSKGLSEEREVSRQLVGLWTEGYDLAMALMERTFPAGETGALGKLTRDVTHQLDVLSHPRLWTLYRLLGAFRPLVDVMC